MKSLLFFFPKKNETLACADNFSGCFLVFFNFTIYQMKGKLRCFGLFTATKIENKNNSIKNIPLHLKVGQESSTGFHF